MYEKHFELKRRIFRGNAAGADVFVGPQTASIVSGIGKAMARPDAVVTLTGPVGCGKSTAAAHALGAISGKNAIVRIGRYPMQCGELLDLIFDHLRIKQRPQRGNQKLALFRQLLLNLARNGSRMFVLVEDALFLSPEILAELEVVTAPDTGPSDGANLVLMGDEFLKELLTSRTLTRLKQRVTLRRTLEPSSVNEISGYLRHCFRQAGGDFDGIFADGAPELLHELSGGILRVVNNLVDSSLESAADAQSATVDLELISRIADEKFGLTGKFTRLPEIGDDQAETQYSDDTTAKLVALSLPEAETDDQQPVPQDNDDDIPQLIQDTQPALAILDDTPSPAKPDSPEQAVEEPQPATDTASPAVSCDEIPAWDRDPTLAELRPDLDALERAMAIARGRDPGANDEPAPPPEDPLAKEQPKDEAEEIPTITLDESINRKVDRVGLENTPGPDKDGLVEDEPCDQKKTGANNHARDEKEAACLENIAAGLAKAKSIEDVDDKMAETLFGEELSVAAAAVAARVAEETAAAAAEATPAPQDPAAPAQPARSKMEKEFESVWGQRPDIEVSIESGIEDQNGGMDISAWQRLAMVRALNAGKPQAGPQKAANVTPSPAVSPEPIEEQITTSLTQTMKALKVNPDPAAVNDDEDDDHDDERDGGFFSRFRRS